MNNQKTGQLTWQARGNLWLRLGLRLILALLGLLLLWNFGGWVLSLPVSYTHLDVYKRQDRLRERVRARQPTLFHSLWELFFIVFLLYFLRQVGWTYIDVYKRQGVTAAVASAAGALAAGRALAGAGLLGAAAGGLVAAVAAAGSQSHAADQQHRNDTVSYTHLDVYKRQS